VNAGFTPNIYPLPYNFNIGEIQQVVANVISTIGFPADNQISIVHRPGISDAWTDGTGSPFKFDDNRKPILDSKGVAIRRFMESDFTVINHAVSDTILAEIYNTLKQDFNVTRFRIARILPKQCYGWHTDEEVRIHIPVFTSPGCFIITDGAPSIATHLPANGSAYMFRANNVYHTAVNSDYSLDRVHLLINVLKST
jgi:hypothetical protein